MIRASVIFLSLVHELGFDFSTPPTLAVMQTPKTEIMCDRIIINAAKLKEN